MTKVGKCDVCRLRKVKCDEQKPTCTPCSRKARPCTYSYGTLSAVVFEDPNQYSGHGRSKTSSMVYPLRARKTVRRVIEEDKLRLTTEKEASKGGGMFLTFEPVDKRIRVRGGEGKKAGDGTLERPISSLFCSSNIDTIIRLPNSPESSLITQYLHTFHSLPNSSNPFSVFGSWTTSIPARIAHDPALYLAAEYLINAFQNFNAPGWEMEKKAKISKGKALKSLYAELKQDLGVKQSRKRGVKWELVMATELHLSAEIFMGVANCYYTIHIGGLTEMLKLGSPVGVEEHHYSELVVSLYIDEVGEALLAGRKSDYDTPLYLTFSSPSRLSSLTPPPSSFMLASTLVMHSFIQIPRLSCLIRHAIASPHDVETLTSAISLAESLWTLDPATAIAPIFGSGVTVDLTPPDPSIADVVPTCFQFDSVQTAVLLTRYWMLRTCLCGILQTIHKHFPLESLASSIPSLSTIRSADISAAVKVSQCLPYTFSFAPEIPVVPLRLISTIQTSIGPWYRRALYLEGLGTDRPLADEEARQLDQACRMQDFIVEMGNRVNDLWGIERVGKVILQAVADVMAGGALPEWLPRKIRFQEVDGELMMRVEY